jgi:serine/threonine-protein kinase
MLLPVDDQQHTSLVPAAAAAGAYGGALGAVHEGERFDHYDDDHQQRRGSPVWPWILALLVLLLLIGGGVAAYLLTRPKKAYLQTVVYLQLPVAQTRLTDAGFLVDPIYEPSKYPNNEVIDQSPRGNQRIKRGSTVILTVSTGPGTTTVPNVSGLSQDAAKAQIRGNGLRVTKVTTQSSTSTPQGEVIGTQPGAGASVTKGQTVTLILSAGEAVPYVVGDSLGDAQAALSQFTSQGTVVNTKDQTTTTAQPDTVVAQYPLAGHTLPKNGSITLTVAKAPDTVRLIRVVGEAPGIAVNQLNQLGLNVNQVPKTTHNPSNVGLVIQQSPTSNQNVKKGIVVTIYIGQAPAGTHTGGTTTTIPQQTTTNVPPPAGTTSTPTTT